MKFIIILSVIILFSCNENKSDEIQVETEIVDSLSYKWRAGENEYRRIANRIKLLPFLLDSFMLDDKITTEAIYGVSSEKGVCQEVDFDSPYTISVDKIESYYGGFGRPFGIIHLNDSIPAIHYKVGFAYSGPLLLTLIYDSTGNCLGSLYGVCWQ